MFGVGAQEMVVIVVVLLLIFGPAKLGHMARELGRFAYKARASMEEFKEEFSVEKYSDQDYEEPRRSHGEHQPEAQDQHSPPKTTQTLLAADERRTDGSLLRSPAKDTVVAESSETVPLGVRE
jgi:Sec-independent protein translocase protein TatA